MPGTQVRAILTSRADSAAIWMASCALGVLMARAGVASGRFSFKSGRAVS